MRLNRRVPNGMLGGVRGRGYLAPPTRFYHINKEQWITVALDGSVSDEQINGFYIVFAYSSRKKDCEVLIFSKRDSNTVSPEGEGRDFLSAVIHSPLFSYAAYL